uniref:Uncharacterized protein n=1 Tax=Glossina pallidipes TaxID=7398 RepID=A0A1A9ZBW0_GLOPL
MSLPYDNRAKIHQRWDHHDDQQAFSSDSSLQSGLPLQKSSFSRHSPSPQDSLPSGQMGSSVFRIGLTLRGSVFLFVGKENRYPQRHLPQRCPEFSSEEKSELSSGGRSSKHFINQILSETVPVVYGKIPADLRTNITIIQGNNQHSRLRSVLITFVLMIVPEFKPI